MMDSLNTVSLPPVSTPVDPAASTIAWTPTGTDAAVLRAAELLFGPLPAPAAAVSGADAVSVSTVASPPDAATSVVPVSPWTNPYASTYAATYATSTSTDVAGSRESAQPTVATAAAVLPLRSSTARRAGTEVWAGRRNPRAVHVSQVASKFNRRPAAGNRDCGPASVLMAMRMVGLAVPGAGTRRVAASPKRSGARVKVVTTSGGASPQRSGRRSRSDAALSLPQRQIDSVRSLAGVTDNAQVTSNHDLARAVKAAGGSTREVRSLASIKAAIVAGSPVVLNGNAEHVGAYGPRVSDKRLVPYDGPHWITVTGYDEATDTYIVNDPMSVVGALKVSAAELEAYRGGSLGVVVSR